MFKSRSVEDHQVEGKMQERRRCILLPLMVTVSAVSAGAQNASSPSSCSLSNFGVHPTGYAHTTLTLTWNTLACSWSDVLELKWRYQGDAQWASGIELSGNESAYTVTELTVGSPYDFSLISAIGRADGLTTQGETLSFDKAIVRGHGLEQLDRAAHVLVRVPQRLAQPRVAVPPPQRRLASPRLARLTGAPARTGNLAAAPTKREGQRCMHRMLRLVRIYGVSGLPGSW